jgi:hypothetical protein
MELVKNMGRRVTALAWPRKENLRVLLTGGKLSQLCQSGNQHFPLALLPCPAYLLHTTSPNPACTEGGSGGTNYRGEAPCARGNLFGPSPSANLAGVEGRRSPVHRSALHIFRSVACRGPVHRLCPPALAWWRILRAPIPSGLWSGTPFDPIPGRAATLPGPSRAPRRASSATESPATRGFRFPPTPIRMLFSALRGGNIPRTAFSVDSIGWLY